ncbi:MAG: YdcF family protein [Clostridia bacterium]|nr:YdcF family protein [Clostridia bacterium]
MKKLKALISAIILMTISLTVIIITGKTYTLKIDRIRNITDIEAISIKFDNENVVKCIEKNIIDGTLYIKVERIGEGKTHLYINDSQDDELFLESIYVNKFGIITVNQYMGDSTCSIAIPIAITIWLMYVLYLLIISYKKSTNENMYRYKNIAYLGIIIFVAIAIVNQFLALFNYNGFINTINAVLQMFSFTTALLPIAFVVSILMIISNILLIRKEGFSISNVLGILLGVVLCFSSVLPEIMYNMLYTATWIDIHNQNGIGVYIYNFIESTIYITITYIECVLIGTVIMGIKASRHIPEFDKDYIIILGCQIKSDGTLTKLLKARVDKAIEFSKKQKEKTGKDLIFIPSGGKGNDEIMSEAQAMKNYLIEQGIKEEKILVEDKSKNTYENIKFSNKLINENKKNAKVAFSTTNYHVFRAGTIATNQNLSIEGIGSKTKAYFWINAFIREFIASLFAEKKKHIAIIGFIIIVALFAIGLQYLANIL